MHMTSETSNEMERRRHPRTQLQLALRCVRLDPDGGDPVDLLHTIDISRSGIGAYTDRAFYPGQRIVLSLPLSSQSGRRNVYATVTRCRQCEEGYRVGLEFDAISAGSRLNGAMATAAA